LNIAADKFSTSALKKIEAAGGSATVIEKKKWVRDRSVMPKKKAAAQAEADKGSDE
jgi:ribosomal protein L18E